MALLQCNFASETLSINTSMLVILPQQTQTQIGITEKKHKDNPPVLYLLHGLSDDDTIWVRRTSIERYVAEYGIAVVMPNVHRSFYCNMEYGGRYWDFVANELPDLVQQFFNISTARKDTFVAGLSMGGYGAFKLALSYPERFSAAASLSGVLDILSWVKRSDPKERKIIFGDKNIEDTPPDLLFLLKQAVDKKQTLPALYLACGTEDFLYESNLKFKAYLEELNVPFTYEESPGVHNWAFWDKYIQHVLRWLPIA